MVTQQQTAASMDAALESGLMRVAVGNQPGQCCPNSVSMLLADVPGVHLDVCACRHCRSTQHQAATGAQLTSSLMQVASLSRPKCSKTTSRSP